MLTKLTLHNFRGFEEHELQIKPITIIVGRNNAGKSTIVEALRLISIVTSRYQKLTYHPPPRWLDIPTRMRGASPDLRNLQIDFDTLCYEYHDPPAIIEATFNNRNSIRIYLGGEGLLHSAIIDKHGKAAQNRAAAIKIKLPHVSIMPQVAPLAKEEKILTYDYVRGAIDSPLAPIHFRNQLRFFYDLFDDFKNLAENTWQGFRIEELDDGRGYPGDPIFLLVRNEEFVGEVAKMGHGLQMWLQAIWFLVRSRDAVTLILDEPDVYMHADLQRRLIRYLKNLGKQVILATHSVEIMSEVEPEEILIVDRKRKRSKFADSIPAVQKLVEYIGSAQNINIIRLWSSRRFIIVEGDDLKILRHLQDKINPDVELSLEAIPNISIGGWGGWQWAIGSSLAIRNALGEAVICYCIFDRDYHLDTEVEERLKEASSKGVELHVWQRKELESYLLEPAAISRLLKKRSEDNAPTPDRILEVMNKVAKELENEVLDGISTELLRRDRSLGAGGANKEARKILTEKKKQGRGLIDIVSGKELLAGISKWAQRKFGVSISVVAVAKELTFLEIPEEIKYVLSAIQEGRKLS